MLFFDRSAEPPTQIFRGGAARSERLALLNLLGESDSRRSQSLLRREFEPDEEAMDALRRLFRAKCAFCESKTELHFHLFRPAGEAEPFERSEFAHLYYAWLRTDWANLYPACADCSKSAGRRFPVRNGRRGPLPDLQEVERFANEDYGVWRSPHRDRPLLLDPCGTRSFQSHLAFDLNGGVQARSRAGAETIAAFALDRDGLASSRRRAFEDYLHLLRDDRAPTDFSEAFDFAALEHGGAWLLLLRRLTVTIAQRLEIQLGVERSGLPGAWKRILTTEIGLGALEASLVDVQRPIAAPARPVVLTARVTPRLASIALRNFKALEEIGLGLPDLLPGDPDGEIEAEASALLLLGENAAGKSSILEAVALALCGPAVRQKLDKAPSGFVLDPGMLGRPGGAAPDAALVHLGFRDGGGDFTLRIAAEFEEPQSRSLPPVFAYGAFRQFGVGASRSRSTGNVGTLFNSTKVLPNPETWLLGLDEPVFAMVARALRRLFTIEGEFDVILPDRANARCLVVTTVGEGEDAKEIRTPLAIVSSGFRSVLAMVCDVFEGLLRSKEVRERGFGGAEAVILIDEIEAHLHPRWKMQIMTAFRRVLPGATIIATTHDPLCLRGMHDGEVVVLNRVRREKDAGDRPPVVVERLAELPSVEGLTVEQLLTSDFFAMFSTDSPDAERRLADLADLLARRAAGDRLSAEDERALFQLEREVSRSLPLGSSEVERIVQDAVAEYLRRRRAASAAQLAGLRRNARDVIVRALEGF